MYKIYNIYIKPSDKNNKGKSNIIYITYMCKIKYIYHITY